MTTQLPATDAFQRRHIGPNSTELQQMLEVVQAQSLDDLITETIPESIRLKAPLDFSSALEEHEFLKMLERVAQKNQIFKSYIGLGYYDCVIPGVIQRNILENPGWYTQYTPYQAEISQGRLEALLNFQTMVKDLTGMEVANASLLDEATAAAEAMTMLFRIRNKRVKGDPANVFFVSDTCFPQTIDLLKTRAEPLDIQIVVGRYQSFEFNESVFGAILQYPAHDGAVENYAAFIHKAHAAGAFVAVAADLLSLALLTPPGEMGADIVVGSSQRFGIPLGYGGPHAAYFATHEDHVRDVPGRIIGVSKDNNGKMAYRMALQTREQHIRRERATSNICTAQALLAIMAGMYAVYHGPEGIRRVAHKVHQSAMILETALNELGYDQLNDYYFDTLKIKPRDSAPRTVEQIESVALSLGVNLRYLEDNTIGISLDETTSYEDLQNLIVLFGQSLGVSNGSFSQDSGKVRFPLELNRQSDYLTHPVFNSYHSETQMLRYIKQLESRDLSLAVSMIPLGSCTMKLNATTEMIPISWPEFSSLHPFVPLEQAQGYQHIINELEADLSQITGFAGVSLQPNSGAQGEYAGLMIIRAYHRDQGAAHRKTILIPSSAHGTNPASASMAGMKVVVVKCDEMGNINVEDLYKKAVKHRDTLAGLMVTYPSTHGVFEAQIQEVCALVHENGGLVYMDGANMNAQVGLTNPANIGADVCHLNLHKTFSIPHGGGGPGMGPICVVEKLTPYLPGHPLIEVGGEKAISSISATPWGSASILLISYAYLKLLGAEGATEATRYAILNANYIKSRLEGHYEILYAGEKGRVAHEMILDTRPFKKSAGIEAEDIAKRLMDYGFHAPTMSFPVPGTLMIEPTESEPQQELDRFCDAMIAIRQEIRDIEENRANRVDNLLKYSPHTIEAVSADEWTHDYSRQTAAFPLPYLRHFKFWPSVGRIDNSYGDRNLICTCPSLESYEGEE